MTKIRLRLFGNLNKRIKKIKLCLKIETPI